MDQVLDIDPNAFRKAVADLRKEMGGRQADIMVSLNEYTSSRDALFGKNFYANVYLNGITRGLSFAESHDTLGDLLEGLQRKWVEFKSEHEKQTIRKMALAIVRITAELGHCTDAALRLEFNEAEVRRFGDQACADANDIAGRGPFSIIVNGGANSEAA